MVETPLLCAGSIVADINIQNLPRFPRPDLEFTERSDVWHDAPARLLIGGTACNAAIVYAELRGACELAGVVGRDELGDFLAAALAERGVKLAIPRGGATATHTIALHRDGRRQAYYFPGTLLDVDGLAERWPGGHLLLTGLNLVVPRERAVAAAQRLSMAARESGGKVAMDIGPPVGEPFSLEEIAALQGQIEVLIGNTHEFEQLLGGPYEDRRTALREYFDGAAVIKRGAAGVTLDAGGSDDMVNIPAFGVAEVNLIGAGDAFAGGFLAAWLGGAALDDACRWGCATGAASVAAETGPQGVRREAVEALTGLSLTD